MTFLRLACLAFLFSLFAGIAQAQEDGEPGEDGAAETKIEKTEKSKPVKQVAIQAPYILVDAATGEVLAEERSGEPWYPASLSKLMTAYIVFHKLKEGKLTLDQPLPVSELAGSQEPSKIGVPVGKTVTVDFALQALLVYSANDMAYVLAEGAAGSIEAFAGEMNAAARRLGLTASHFVNPNGLFDPRQISSARDMAVLSAVMLAEFPERAHYFDQEYVAVGKRRLPNRNRLIRTMPEADGMKTGFVCASGFNLVASATREGRRLIAVVMGYKNSLARAEAARALLVGGFDKKAGLSPRKIADVFNMPQGSIVPTDMTTTLCKNKPAVPLKDAATLAGWGVSFGTYDTGLKADMALRGRILNPHGINVKAMSGVIQLPGKAGFGAWMWGLDQTTSEGVCRSYNTDGAHCEVLDPDVTEKIAAEAKARKEAIVLAQAEAKRLELANKLRKKYKRQFGH